MKFGEFREVRTRYEYVLGLARPYPGVNGNSIVLSVEASSPEEAKAMFDGIQEDVWSVKKLETLRAVAQEIVQVTGQRAESETPDQGPRIPRELA